MFQKFILSEYIEVALSHAIYDKLEDDSFCGKIPQCRGVIAFSKTLRGCEDDLRSTLEDWILLGLKLDHKLPVVGSINLNKRISREQAVAVQT